MFRKIKERELLYKTRIKELENVICPGEQHDYALVNETPTFKEYGIIVYHRRYVCKRCLKAKEESDLV
jgi:hypothetical protein